MREPDDYDHADHDSPSDTLHIRWPVVLTVVGYIVAIVVAYKSLDATNGIQDNRLQNLEYNQRLMVDDVREIKTDIKQLLRQQTP